MASSPLLSLRIAVTADLHFGTRHTAGFQSTRKLADRLFEQCPDLLILAGDVGAGEDFERCLELFDTLDCTKALVPGNHDIWVRLGDTRGDSLELYETHLPNVCRNHGFAYLDRNPLLFPDAGFAVVGSMNWYDYSWDADKLKAATGDWEERLRTKRFLRGMHNDANFVRWPLTDLQFTDRVVAKLIKDVDDALAQVAKAVVVTHHPPIRGLLFPAREPLGIDALLWRAFSGNERLEAALIERAAKIPFTFCGHTHSAVETEVDGMRGYNIGGDYHFKRLLWLDWPAGTVTAEEFHAD